MRSAAASRGFSNPRVIGYVHTRPLYGTAPIHRYLRDNPDSWSDLNDRLLIFGKQHNLSDHAYDGYVYESFQGYLQFHAYRSAADCSGGGASGPSAGVPSAPADVPVALTVAPANGSPVTPISSSAARTLFL